jgi:hypothetical protein
MTHEIYRVVSFEHIAPFTLRVLFDDGSAQVIDFRPVLEGELFGPLQNSALCNQVQIEAKLTPLSGPMGPTLIPPRCTTGLKRLRL